VCRPSLGWEKVFLGSAMAVIVAFVMAKIWVSPEEKSEVKPSKV
jgi:hypothetical protein